MGHTRVIVGILVAACSSRAPSTDRRPVDAAVTASADARAPVVAPADRNVPAAGRCRLDPPGGAVVAVGRERSMLGIEAGRSGVLVYHAGSEHSGPRRGPAASCTWRPAIVARRVPLSEGPSFDVIPMGPERCPADDPGEAQTAFVRYAGEAAYVDCRTDGGTRPTTRCILRQPFVDHTPPLIMEPIDGRIRQRRAAALGDTLIFLVADEARHVFLFSGRGRGVRGRLLGELPRGPWGLLADTESDTPFVGWQEPGRTSWRQALNRDGQPFGAGRGGQPQVQRESPDVVRVGDETVRVWSDVRPTPGDAGGDRRALFVAPYDSISGSTLSTPQVLVESALLENVRGVRAGPDGPTHLVWSDAEGVRVATLSCRDR